MNTQTVLALQVLRELAQAGGKMSISEAAKRSDVAPSYTGTILQSLRDVHIVRATRGPKGGYELAKPADKLSVAEVMTKLEGAILPDTEQDVPKTRSIKFTLRVPIGEVLKKLMISDL